jgi:hypothetical protein
MMTVTAIAPTARDPMTRAATHNSIATTARASALATIAAEAETCPRLAT